MFTGQLAHRRRSAQLLSRFALPLLVLQLLFIAPTLVLHAQQAPPTITAISPASAALNPDGTITLSATLTGTNFVSGASITSDDPQVTFSNVNVVNSTQIN